MLRQVSGLSRWASQFASAARRAASDGDLVRFTVHHLARHSPDFK